MPRLALTLLLIFCSFPAVAAAAPPVSVSPPVIDDPSPAVGDTLHAGGDTWDDALATVTYQWRRCDSDGQQCADIPDATDSAYSVAAADVAKRLQVQATASNADGQSAPSASGLTDPVHYVPPQNTAKPSISGTPRSGETLTAHEGAWSGTSPTIIRQWLRCDASGAGCEEIPGATGRTLLLGAADQGHTIRVRETASNGGGEASEVSEATALVPVPPQSTGKPSIAGTPRSGQTLTAGDGTWSGTLPVTVVRQWLRCDGTGGNCAAIAGGTGPTLALGEADAQHTIRVRETASNGAGQATADSDPTALVLVPVSNVAPPQITGTPVVGNTLVGSLGRWAGTPPFLITRRWQRCPGDEGTCADVPGRVSDVYTLGAADAGTRIRVIVRAANDAGDASAASELSGPVTTAPAGGSGPPLPAAAPLTGSFDGRPRRADLARALGRKLKIRARCSGPCRIAVRLSVSKQVARKWRVPRTVAVGRRALAAAGRAVVRPRFAKTTRVRLRPARALAVVVAAEVRDGAGKLATQRTWKLTLAR